MTLHHDEVALSLNGERLAITEGYTIREGILEQPAHFEIKLGHGGVTRELLAKYPPNSRFQVLIGPAPVQTGYTDGFNTGDGNGATSVTFEGRDLAARLLGFIKAERSFQEKSFRALLETALKAVGLEDEPIFADNTANRKAITGIDIVTEPVVTEVTLEDGTKELQQTGSTKKTVHKTIKAKLGTRWLDFLNTQFERAGLFLWAAGGGGFVLSAPTAAQPPTYRLIRRRGRTDLPVNVVQHSFRHNIAQRYTKCIVYGRGGGKNFGRTKNRGEWIDPEMTKLLGGEDLKLITVHDEDVKTPKQAEFMARRQIAEANRNGWQLNYTVSGHSAPSLKGTGRAVWTPDTTVDVDDDELGIKGVFYLEACTHVRQPHTLTTLHLMRPEDLVFGDGLF